MTGSFVAETSFHVRYAETDAMGIVHHASYIVYFEEGRSEYIRQRGSSYAQFERDGFYLAVSEVHARYHAPARYDDELTIKTWVSKVRSRSLTFQYEILSQTGERHVTGYSSHICITQDGKVTRIPPDWLKWT